MHWIVFLCVAYRVAIYWGKSWGSLWLSSCVLLMPPLVFIFLSRLMTWASVEFYCIGSWSLPFIGFDHIFYHIYEGWSKSSFLFLIQRKVWILSKFCDVHIEIKYISSKWLLFEKLLWRHSLWHVTSRDTHKGVIVVNRFSRVTSAKFEIFFHSKKHSIPLRNANLKLTATDPNTI